MGSKRQTYSRKIIFHLENDKSVFLLSLRRKKYSSLQQYKAMLTPTENVCKYQLRIYIFCENFQNDMVKEQMI